MQARHAVLADGIHARETRCADAIVSSPRFSISLSAAFQASPIRFANDDVQPNAERDIATACAPLRQHLDLLGDISRRLAPHEVLVDARRGNVVRGIR